MSRISAASDFDGNLSRMIEPSQSPSCVTLPKLNRFLALSQPRADVHLALSKIAANHELIAGYRGLGINVAVVATYGPAPAFVSAQRGSASVASFREREKRRPLFCRWEKVNHARSMRPKVLQPQAAKVAKQLSPVDKPARRPACHPPIYNVWKQQERTAGEGNLVGKVFENQSSRFPRHRLRPANLQRLELATRLMALSILVVSQFEFLQWVMGWTAPDGIDCARMRSLQISNKGDRPWNRLAELAWIRRNIFSSFMG